MRMNFGVANAVSSFLTSQMTAHANPQLDRQQNGASSSTLIAIVNSVEAQCLALSDCIEKENMQ